MSQLIRHAMMDVMQLTETQRFFVADKLMDSANYALTVLVFGQLVTATAHPGPMVLGVLIYAMCWVIAVRLRKGAKPR